MANLKDINTEEVEKEMFNEILENTEEVEKEMKVETKEKPKANKGKKNDLDYEARGFKTLEEACNFVNTDIFKNLGRADREEYLKWLNK